MSNTYRSRLVYDVTLVAFLCVCFCGVFSLTGPNLRHEVAPLIRAQGALMCKRSWYRADKIWRACTAFVFDIYFTSLSLYLSTRWQQWRHSRLHICFGCPDSSLKKRRSMLQWKVSSIIRLARMVFCSLHSYERSQAADWFSWLHRSVSYLSGSGDSWYVD